MGAAQGIGTLAAALLHSISEARQHGGATRVVRVSTKSAAKARCGHFHAKNPLACQGGHQLPVIFPATSQSFCIALVLEIEFTWREQLILHNAMYCVSL
jgi:hypothetical protein